ncbi:UNVERIFIED_CONTAM: hypothetical protein PYX00_007767 [Menopon gallinae]|uniref:Coiled-coil domain-containing protein 186 n=1 Tax=Menopon gallinae TaxID=328185 RepID=A0AAW2HLN7_9NEOP
MEENCFAGDTNNSADVKNEETENKKIDLLTVNCNDTILEDDNIPGLCIEENGPHLLENHSSELLQEIANDEEVFTSGNLINEVILLKEQNKSLQDEILILQKENARLEADRSAELHVIQLEGLEKTISQQKNEIQQLQESFKQQAEMSQKYIMQMKQEYESKLDKVNKKFDIANKERESMVMKYAIGEKSVIDLKREIQSLETKVKDMIKEKEANQMRLKNISAEKVKLNQLLDSKISEIAMMERENQKRKDEIQMRDSKIKWAQNRLKTEMDSHSETQNKLEKLQQKYNEVREEAEQYKKHTQTLIKNYQEAQEEKNNQEQEEKARLIIDKHDEETLAKLQFEIENYKKKQKNLVDENNHLSLKIQNLEKERLEYDHNLSKLKQAVDAEKRTVIDMTAQLTDFESTKTLLQHEQERITSCQKEIERLRTSNTDLQQEMESCREREAELLEFTQKLTEKNVRLQSEFTAVEARAHQLQIEHNSCERDINNLESTVSSLTKELEREKNQREEETTLLKKRLTEQTEKSDSLAQELVDQQGENQLLKKKHLVALKELSKELSVLRKRLEMYENSNASLAEGSRTSSTASLNNVEAADGKTVTNNHSSPANPLAVPADLDPQVLINKIIEIQKSNARKTEKVEFLKEHVKQLVAELQKKTRIIQNYIIREQAGALSSETMDNYKAALSKHGGIMASVYNSKAVDEGMTLEFSLKINKKLQAVLEDTLLKNITLKENIETLGNEIARLTASEVSKQESS